MKKHATKITTLLASTAMVSAMLINAMAPAFAQPIPVVDAAANLRLITDIANTGNTVTRLETQIQNWETDHININALGGGQITAQAQQLVQFVQQNQNLITTAFGADQTLLNQFKQVVPHYTGSTDYLTYLATMKRNMYDQYAATLTAGNATVANEQQVAAKIKTITSPVAINDLQALQQLISLANVQATQMDALVKINAAMLKSMNLAYMRQANLATGGSGGSGGSGGTSTATDIGTVKQLCLASNPGLMTQTPDIQQAAIQQCTAAMNNANNIAQ